MKNIKFLSELIGLEFRSVRGYRRVFSILRLYHTPAIRYSYIIIRNADFEIQYRISVVNRAYHFGIEILLQYCNDT